MLTVKMKDTQGVVSECIPVSVVFYTEENVPADSLMFSAEGIYLKEICTVELLRDGKVIFDGEIDEQIVRYDISPVTEFVARSQEAKLIDNEAYPMAFMNPSAEDIFTKYAELFGFTLSVSENKSYNGRFTVAKGTSCFAAIKRFAAEVYGAFPKAKGNVLYLDGIKNQGAVVLADENKSCCQRLSVGWLRCNRVSQVRVKIADNGGYDSGISDEEACADGINKVRYLNVSSSGGATLSDADKILSASKSDSFYAEALCTGYFGDALGKEAVHRYIDGDLYVSAIKYVSDKKGEYTRLTLRRKES